MMRVTLASRVRVRDDVMFRDVEGELVLLNLTTGVYFGLDALGTRIWHLLPQRPTLHGLRDSLLDEYDVTAPHCEDDLIAFIQALRDHELVEVEPGPVQ